MSVWDPEYWKEIDARYIQERDRPQLETPGSKEYERARRADDPAGVNRVQIKPLPGKWKTLNG